MVGRGIEFRHSDSFMTRMEPLNLGVKVVALLNRWAIYLCAIALNRTRGLFELLRLVISHIVVSLQEKIMFGLRRPDSFGSLLIAMAHSLSYLGSSLSGMMRAMRCHSLVVRYCAYSSSKRFL